MTDTADMEREEREARIAEYVLGTLSGAERSVFEAELARDGALRREVANWSERLQPLADSVPQVAPPATLRSRVMDRIGSQDEAASERPFSLTRWLAWTLGLSTLAGAIAAALVFVFMPQLPELGGYAMLHEPTGGDGVVAFQVDRDRHDMVVLADAPQPVAGHDYELWILPPEKNPISLGIVTAGIREVRPLSAEAVKYLTQGASLGISLEPAGGAPAGVPTGPVVFTGVFHLAK